VILNGLPTRGPDSRYAYRYGYGVGAKYGDTALTIGPS
jgi:hypothetical protein